MYVKLKWGKFKGLTIIRALYTLSGILLKCSTFIVDIDLLSSFKKAMEKWKIQILFEESMVYSESPLTGAIFMLWQVFLLLSDRKTLERLNFLLLFWPYLRDKLDSKTIDAYVFN